MKLIDELTDIYLEGPQEEIRYLFDPRTEKILLDAPESLTGEPELDWDSEEFEEVVEIPMAESSEMYQLMEQFAETQADTRPAVLLAALGGRKPFRHFKDTAHELGCIEEWYLFERRYAEGVMEEWLRDIH